MGAPPSGIVRGNQEVIAATYASLEEFPDRRLLGEDVIWSGSPEEGMLSSHRIYSTATHAKDGVYGKATGRTSHSAKPFSNSKSPESL